MAALTDRRRGHEILPTLSDALMFAKQPFWPLNDKIPRKTREAIRQAHRTSRAFVFDRAASYRVGEICSYMPDLIADEQEFARCPYPQTFIEIESEALIAAMKDAGLPTHVDPTSPLDEKIGFLFTERGIYTATKAGDTVSWAPFAFRPHQPMTYAQEQRFCEEFGCSRIIIDRFLWGNSYDRLDPSRRRSLRAQHGFDVLMPEGWSSKPKPLNTLLRGGGAGDFKVALTAALLLIRPNMLTTIETREPARKLVLGRPTTFLAHRVVTIKLSRDRLIRRIRAACKEDRGRLPTRWHEVRGHYAHSHRAKIADCVHDWQEVAPLKWECRQCGGKRVWRTYPEGRGDASIGVVTKHYAVRP